MSLRKQSMTEQKKLTVRSNLVNIRRRRKRRSSSKVTLNFQKMSVLQISRSRHLPQTFLGCPVLLQKFQPTGSS